MGLQRRAAILARITILEGQAEALEDAFNDGTVKAEARQLGAELRRAKADLANATSLEALSDLEHSVDEASRALASLGRMR